jgi:hypothetical protein
MLHEQRPEGYALIVEVYVLGREDPIQLGVVETSRANDRPWTWLQAAGSARASANVSERRPHADGEWIFLPEQHIVRVQLRYVPVIDAPQPPETPEFREDDDDKPEEEPTGS